MLQKLMGVAYWWVERTHKNCLGIILRKNINICVNHIGNGSQNILKKDFANILSITWERIIYWFMEKHFCEPKN